MRQVESAVTQQVEVAIDGLHEFRCGNLAALAGEPCAENPERHRCVVGAQQRPSGTFVEEPPCSEGGVDCRHAYKTIGANLPDGTTSGV
ncbi:hypothetical protein GCM10010038_15170 [Glutamicibacter protophormiae]|nr:hypothetical protein GCM10010038_15170 [Glutamicibacter protophormiae]